MVIRCKEIVYKKESDMGDLGFTHYEGNAVLWKVTHSTGQDFVHAPTEALAIQRYQAKYPNRKILKVERK